jgi:signal transduction histidine kinase
MSDYITVLLAVVTVINAALGLLILLSPGKQASSRIYSLIMLTTLLWIFSIIFYRQSSPENIVLWTKALYISASLIASTFLFFTYMFPVKDDFPWWKKAAVVLPNVFIIALIVFGDYIISDATVNLAGENVIIFGKFYFLYVVYILAFFNYAFYRLYEKSKTLTEVYQRRQALFFLTGYLISSFIAFTTNLILPWFGYFALNWMGQASTVFLVTFATYAIIKHQLFNIKAIAAELFVGALWIFLLIRIILGNNLQEKILNGGLLVITILIGIFLIKAINNEVKTREHIEKLANELESANERLKDLDSQKNEFVSMASHQLRGPLTAVKGYASMILEGDFGDLLPTVKEAIEKIYKSTQDLVVVVGDYLDVSRIEQGRMQYDFSTFDLKELVQTVVNELKPNIEKANLSIQFDATPGFLYTVNADKGKIKQVIGNIIDNSVKYTPKGGIHVWLVPKKDKLLISISDTGVGIHPDVMPKLFAKFTRAPDASKTNILGTGLGLYVAKKMIEAHDGRVWAESAGPGKGSTFFIELDLADANDENNRKGDEQGTRPVVVQSSSGTAPATLPRETAREIQTAHPGIVEIVHDDGPIHDDEHDADAPVPLMKKAPLSAMQLSPNAAPKKIDTIRPNQG